MSRSAFFLRSVVPVLEDWLSSRTMMVTRSCCLITRGCCGWTAAALRAEYFIEDPLARRMEPLLLASASRSAASERSGRSDFVRSRPERLGAGLEALAGAFWPWAATQQIA